jgi:hypothetical protein
MRLVELAVLLGALGLAHADGAADRVTADSLFDDARKLMTAGKTAEACAKFETSMKLDPRLGTELNLADCHEKLGKLATAWGEWREAGAMARQAKDPRATVAHDREQAIEPKLTRIVIKIADGQAGLTVERDGTVLDPSVAGTAIPVDLGDHTVDVSAPGRVPFHHTVTADRPGTIEVDVPILAVQKVPAPHRSSARKPAGLATGAAGVVLVGVGIAVGFVAKSHYDAARRDDCDAQGLCSDTGYDRIDGAYRTATISTILVGVGAAAIAGGLILYLVPEHKATEASAWIAPAGAGLVVAGSF